MFCGDLLKVLGPVLVEAELLLAEGVETLDQLLDALFEARFV